MEQRRLALVVDDVDEMLDLVEIALRGADFSVLRASSVPDALRLFETRAEEIDLLLIDVRIGTDSGLDLARELLLAKPSLQVLAVSEFARDWKLVKRHKGIAFLSKPFSASELKKQLNALFTAEASRA
jgi:CheY-like chemotaxis protein